MRQNIFLLCLFSGLILASQDRGFKRVSSPSSKDFGVLYDNMHALIVGNSDYTHGWPSLPGVDEDILSVSQALKRLGFNVSVAKNLTKSRLDSAFTDFISLYGSNQDVGLLFYFAGHGHTVDTNYGEKLGYIVPTNAPDPNVDAMTFQSNAIEMAQMEIYAKRISSKHALFIFDACFSGSIFSTTRAIPEVISYKTSQPVRQFISSGTENEKVSDESIFRKQFVEAITTDNADFNDDGYLTGTELGRFLQSSVINYSLDTQHPQYGKMNNPALNKGDFVFLLKSDEKKDDFQSDLTATPFDLENTGSIELTTELGGDLYLDNKLLAAVSPNTIVPILDIKEGSHVLEIKGMEKWRSNVLVSANEASTIKAGSVAANSDEVSFIEMVYVQGGTFDMGGEDGDSDELPIHPITLNDFEISPYEVTVGQFGVFVEETGYRTEAEIDGWSWVFDGEWKKKNGYHWRMNARGESASDNEPVTFVSWNDCQRFTEWLSTKYNSRFRLPTEAEWEYAARGGIHSTYQAYSGGDIAPFLGWFNSNSESMTHPVGEQIPNELNLYDMSGNVWEWCSDWYEEKYYERSSTSNPKGVLNGDYRVLRGGSWNNNESSGRVTNRHKNRPDERDSFTGFRVVRETF